MDWDKISISAVMKLLKKVEEETPSLFGEYSVVYSDGKEEVKITYTKLKKLERGNKKKC